MRDRAGADVTARNMCTLQPYSLCGAPTRASGHVGAISLLNRNIGSDGNPLGGSGNTLWAD